MNKRSVALFGLILSTCMALPGLSRGAVLVVDNFRDNFYVDLDETVSISTSNAVGGQRYVDNSAILDSRRAPIFNTINGYSTRAFLASGYANNQSVSIGYGYAAPLNLNLTGYTDYGDPDRIFIRGYAYTDFAQNGAVINLTLFDGVNSFTLGANALYAADNIARPVEWDVNTFADHGVDITSIDRITFSINNIRNNGDIYFGILSSGLVPEPNTAIMMVIAVGVIQAARKRGVKAAA